MDIKVTIERVHQAFDNDARIDALRAWIERIDAVGQEKDDARLTAIAQQWTQDMAYTIEHATKMSLRRWFSLHEGSQIDTLQVHATGECWSPIARQIEWAGATFARIEGSRRSYVGYQVLAATQNAIIIANDHLVCAYRVTTPTA